MARNPKPLQRDLEEFTKAKLDANGHEVVSSIPEAPPLGYQKQPSMVDHVRQMVRSEMLRREVETAGVETFEEADDFDIADDPIDPSTPYEEVFDPGDFPSAPPPPAEVAAAPAAVPSSTAPVDAAAVPPAAPPKSA